MIRNRFTPFEFRARNIAFQLSCGIGLYLACFRRIAFANIDFLYRTNGRFPLAMPWREAEMVQHGCSGLVLGKADLTGPCICVTCLPNLGVVTAPKPCFGRRCKETGDVLLQGAARYSLVPPMKDFCRYFISESHFNIEILISHRVKWILRHEKAETWKSSTCCVSEA